MQKFISILFCSFVVVSTSFACELGDISKFAVRFDDNTGNLTEIVYRGEPITIPGGGDRRFDIQISRSDSSALIWVSTGRNLNLSVSTKNPIPS
ncbi:MAG: hypothetical protein LBU65_04810 [Planctomycetaceae bacterium]|nr:hypothetical protein [Planctomycetaceae bacterium]